MRAQSRRTRTAVFESAMEILSNRSVSGSLPAVRKIKTPTATRINTIIMILSCFTSP
jgi:hypothetical protein